MRKVLVSGQVLNKITELETFMKVIVRDMSHTALLVE